MSFNTQKWAGSILIAFALPSGPAFAAEPASVADINAGLCASEYPSDSIAWAAECLVKAVRAEDRGALLTLTYVGPPLIFQFDEVARGVGLLAPSSLLRVGGTTYFLGADGFYAFDGAGLTNIGDEKVNRWFSAQLAADTLWQIHGAADTTSPLLYWSFVSVDSTDMTQPDKALIYNRAVDKFSVAEFAHELIFPGLSSGLTLEQIGGIYGALEDVPGSFDSASWAGGGVLLNAFSLGHKLAEFSGAALEAVLDTPEFEAVPFRRSRLIGLRPLCDSAAAIAKVKSRARLGDNAGQTATGPMQPNGDIPLLSSGRYHRAEITIPAGAAWTYIQGVDVEAVDDGGR